MPCLSGRFNPSSGAIIRLGVSAPRSAASGDHEVPPPIWVNALIDTGANTTCVSQAVLQRFALPTAGKVRFASAAGTGGRNTDVVNLLSDFRPDAHIVDFADMIVIGVETGRPEFDALLGNDILCKGLFQVFGSEEQFIFCI